MRTGPLLAAVALLGALAGCVPAAHPSPSPSATSTPVFASDAEALAAAEKAYAAYLKVSDEVAHDGWRDVDSLPAVVRGAALANDLKTAHTFASRSWRQVGNTSFDSLTLQSVEDHANGKVAVSVYLCIDVSKVDVVGPDGLSVVPTTRETRVPLEVAVDNLDSKELKVSRNDSWSGTDFC